MSKMPSNEYLLGISQRDMVKIENALAHIFSYYDIPNEVKIEKIRYANEFLKYSDNDIKTANLLYNNKLYSNALYSLQQAVEKLSKAYAISFLILNNKEVRKVSHYSPMAFIKLIEKFKSLFVSMDVALYKTGIINIENLDIKNFSAGNYTTLLKRSASDIARMESEEISSLLKVGQIFTDMKNNPDFKNNIRELLSTIKNRVETDDNSMDKEETIRYIDVTLDYLDDMVGDMVFDNYYMYLPELYILSIITYPHENESRYPDTKNMGLEEYNEELGIVKKFEDIFSRVVFIRKELEIFFNQELERYGYEESIPLK